MSFFTKKRLVLGGLFLLAIVLPVTILFFQNQQNIRSRADKTVVLSYEPGSTAGAPLQIPAGSTFSLDVFVDPGASAVSYVKAELVYDTGKFEAAGGFIPNQEAFSQVIESTDAPGKVTTTLSVGSDTSKALKAKTKIGTISLRALSTVATNSEGTINFGAGSQALAISANSSFNENVIANTVPAVIRFNQPSNVCGNASSDTMLVIDRSGSMADKEGTSGTKISNAKTAASNFIDIVARDAANKFGLVSFATTASLNSPIASDANSVKSQINSLSTSSYTCIECGILKANQEIAAKKRAGTKNIVILLTDGRANVVEGNTATAAEATAELKATNAAISGYNANGTIFFTIGLGKDVNSEFLTKLAEKTGGQYYYSPTTDQLNGIYNQISQIIAKGSVAGNVFNDTNANGTLDQGEENLPGAIVQLHSSTQSPQSVTSDSTGNFAITNLCDGNYTLKQVLQSGWKQTFPANSGDHTIAIANGSAITNKNFGNNKGTRCSDGIDNDGNGFIDTKDSTCHTDGDPTNPNSYDPNKDGERGGNTCADSIDNNNDGKIDGADPVCHTDGDPTKPWDPNLPENAKPTPTPTAAPTIPPPANAAQFNLDVILHGIGSGGDNANPTANSFSNKTPLNPIQQASIRVFNASNQLFATASGVVTYSSASGSYKGVLTADKAISAGPYIIRVTIDKHLTRLVPGIQSLKENVDTSISSIQVVAGDITRDNRLDIRDYNNILDCYSDLLPPVSCDDPQKKKDTDINDDGNVGQFDYNLFLRELSTQPGE